MVRPPLWTGRWREVDEDWQWGLVSSVHWKQTGNNNNATHSCTHYSTHYGTVVINSINEINSDLHEATGLESTRAAPDSEARFLGPGHPLHPLYRNGKDWSHRQTLLFQNPITLIRIFKKKWHHMIIKKHLMMKGGFQISILFWFLFECSEGTHPSEEVNRLQNG